ncbi:hypothetical protein LCGC14_2523240 [marine sediment metagenome]|uniref:Uncharacterized protein n=1 Tax=marine sediment metagenome TaxID=412755 RepID=A0A0F9AVU7_9ZZZZ
MVEKFKFFVTGISKKTGKKERFAAKTKSEIKREITPLLTDVKIREGGFVIRRRKR